VNLALNVVNGKGIAGNLLDGFLRSLTMEPNLIFRIISIMSLFGVADVSAVLCLMMALKTLTMSNKTGQTKTTAD